MGCKKLPERVYMDCNTQGHTVGMRETIYARRGRTTDDRNCHGCDACISWTFSHEHTPRESPGYPSFVPPGARWAHYAISRGSHRNTIRCYWIREGMNRGQWWEAHLNSRTCAIWAATSRRANHISFCMVSSSYNALFYARRPECCVESNCPRPNVIN